MRSDGTVWVTGDNSRSQLGILGIRESLVFQQLDAFGDVKIVDIAAAHYSSFAVDENGQVWVWGYNHQGQFDSLDLYVDTPTLIPGLSNVAKIEVSFNGTVLALTKERTVLSWGNNQIGQAGYDNSTQSDSISSINYGLDLSNIVQIIVDDQYSLARAEDGTIYGWGREYDFETDSEEERERVWMTPQVVMTAQESLIKIAADGQYLYTLQDQGNVLRFSFSNGFGLAINQNEYTEIAQADVVDIVARDYTFFMIKEDGTAWGMGYGGEGSLGNQVFESANDTPVVVNGFSDTKFIAIGQRHTLGLGKYSGSENNSQPTEALYGWGNNWYGQLGNGQSAKSTTPFLVESIQDVATVKAGEDFTVFLKNDQTVWTMGSNVYGQLGVGAEINGQHLAQSGVPLKVDIEDVVQIAVNYYTVYALKSDGMIWAWGSADGGHIGYGAYEHAFTPVQVAGLNNIAYIAAGGGSIVAINQDGEVFGWGDDNHGKLCLPETQYNLIVPTLIESLTEIGIQKLSIGASHALYLSHDGQVFACGSDHYGQQGNGVELPQDLEETEALLGVDTPTRVIGLDDILVSDVVATHRASMALTADGFVYLWGRDPESNGVDSFKSVPEKLDGLSDITSISGGYYYMLIIDSLDNPSAAGDNNSGQLGLGHFNSPVLFVQIPGLEGIQEVSGGFTHSVAITTTDGFVYTMGSNSHGQSGFGLGNTGIVLEPMLALFE
ncbi:hypothetical protein ISS03_05845 [Patescibacteria group bacterium]|nr:hypothetical protein [Patescibacteria group bacterium]